MYFPRMPDIIVPDFKQEEINELKLENERLKKENSNLKNPEGFPLIGRFIDYLTETGLNVTGILLKVDDKKNASIRIVNGMPSEKIIHNVPMHFYVNQSIRKNNTWKIAYSKHGEKI